MPSLPSIAVALFAGLLGAAATWGVLSWRQSRLKPLPSKWGLSARPVFSAGERLVYRHLREALPHHAVLAKLPIVRLCQPDDPGTVRYWYDLLGSVQVAFAVCSANGRVLVAIDLENERGFSRRATQIKQAVLAACRIRYLCCTVEGLPSSAELQLLVPSSSAQARGPQPQPQPMPSEELHVARHALASAVANRRAERSTLWHDSAVFQDSFFAPDSRHDGFAPSEYTGLAAAGVGPVALEASTVGAFRHTAPAAPETADENLGGIVIDSPEGPTAPRR